MSIKSFDVSISVWGKVAAGVFLRGIEADSEASALNKGVSKTCASGVFSPRVCAILKEAARRGGSTCARGYIKFHGIEVVEWAIESKDKSKGKVENKGE